MKGGEAMALHGEACAGMWVRTRVVAGGTVCDDGLCL